MYTLKCLLLVICLGLLLPLQASPDVIFTDAEYESLQQTLEELEKLNNDNLTLEDSLHKMNEQLQSSYKKQKVYLITGSILTIISVGIISYEVGAFNGR